MEENRTSELPRTVRQLLKIRCISIGPRDVDDHQ